MQNRPCFPGALRSLRALDLSIEIRREEMLFNFHLLYDIVEMN